ncbi:MAG: BatA domain-containing protein [Gammaproteobacteria bacterium]|nr:MAG: BatA domain-containing protein [Gammaproteobacteria bacterium]
MGFAWINPLYLAGCLLLALPVLIHLVQKHRPSGARFPSLMFLRRIPLQEKRRLEIRHWLLLLLRCLLLLLIVLAFARPFVTGSAVPADANSQQRDSVIVLDRSYSMRIGDRWQQAQAAALDRIRRASPQQRFALVLFDEEAEVVSDLSGDRENLASLIRRERPGLGATRLSVALEQAARLLVGSQASEKRILLISDFHAAPDDVAGIDRAIGVETLPVETDAVINAGITDYVIGPPPAGGLGEFSLHVALKNYSQQAVERQLELVLNGRVVESRSLVLEPGTSRDESFDELTFSGDLARGIVRLDADVLATDDQVFFVYSKNQQVPVLLIENEDARPNQAVFIENALRLSPTPVYRVRRTSWSQLDADELDNWALIIVNDAALPGTMLADALRGFVSGGGGLLVATGESVQGNWPSDESGYLPGKLLRRVDAAPGRARRIGRISGHPALAGIDPGRVSVFSYRELEPNPGDRVLAAYDDGAVALLERRLDAGRVVVLTSTLDAHWNDLALRPVFVPLLHRLLNYMAAFESYSNSLQVGETVDVLRYARALSGADAVIAAAGDTDLTIESPSATDSRLQRDAPLLQLNEQGFYQVHRATPVGMDVVLAVNIDAAEAGLERLDLARFEEEIRTSALPRADSGVMMQREAAEYEQRQQLWHDILSLVLLLMLIEAFAANWTAVRRTRVN